MNLSGSRLGALPSLKLLRRRLLSPRPQAGRSFGPGPLWKLNSREPCPERIDLQVVPPRSSSLSVSIRSPSMVRMFPKNSDFRTCGCKIQCHRRETHILDPQNCLHSERMKADSAKQALNIEPRPSYVTCLNLLVLALDAGQRHHIENLSCIPNVLVSRGCRGLKRSSKHENIVYIPAGRQLVL